MYVLPEQWTGIGLLFRSLVSPSAPHRGPASGSMWGAPRATTASFVRTARHKDGAEWMGPSIDPSVLSGVLNTPLPLSIKQLPLTCLLSLVWVLCMEQHPSMTVSSKMVQLRHALCGRPTCRDYSPHKVCMLVQEPAPPCVENISSETFPERMYSEIHTQGYNHVFSKFNTIPKIPSKCSYSKSL